MDGASQNQEIDITDESQWEETMSEGGDEDVFAEVAQEWLEENAEAGFKKIVQEWLRDSNKSEVIAENYARSKYPHNRKAGLERTVSSVGFRGDGSKQRAWNENGDGKFAPRLKGSTFEK